MLPVQSAKVVILCGGQGTRMREETEFRPKPLVEVGRRPILWHIMKTFAHYGLRRFVLCLGYRGKMIKEYFLNYEAMNNDFTICLGQQHRLTLHDAHAEQDFHVTLADTGEDTMTGGRVKRVERYIDGDTFLVTYGDGVADVDIAALLDFHRRHGRLQRLARRTLLAEPLKQVAGSQRKVSIHKIGTPADNFLQRRDRLGIPPEYVVRVAQEE